MGAWESASQPHFISPLTGRGLIENVLTFEASGPDQARGGPPAVAAYLMPAQRRGHGSRAAAELSPSSP